LSIRDIDAHEVGVWREREIADGAAACLEHTQLLAAAQLPLDESVDLFQRLVSRMLLSHDRPPP
jgi:hypothetical protein